MGGCASCPADKYKTSQEVADLRAQVDQLQKALALAHSGGASLPPAPPIPAPGNGFDSGVVETLFFPDSKLPCRNMRKPGGCRRPHCEFAHEPTSLTRFLAHLAAATRHLDICVFTITNDDISDVVLDLHRKGVKIRVITDNDQAQTQGSDIDKFRAVGIPVRQDRSPAHMHHKFAIIDGRVLLNGSFNWTRQAVTGNNENVTVMSDARLISAFQTQFNKLWEAFKQ
ncbi:MT associated signaling protein phospholipase D [Volvox carteri f. nagariensis]|uniref:Mitochondrial cardiolipin hydrolase n=1 Tax=Volvox carteri f. nagariensis TaxID=3068 RepID=D8UHV0_VOLCA|nr:MT associated signaling protein phospholipase D [Volvox carteri f. nagariensis]EFJ40702.1 MT associated signaling protein phospholipase D [Volvox carteri f. nagariensis]|eukprot:XP_002958248.1 MT associated signaling protein phospholipase D [Volvox carteri f. nagariensis]